MWALEFQHDVDLHWEWWKGKKITSPSLAAIGNSKLNYNRDVSAWTQGCADFAGSLTVIEPLEHYAYFSSFCRISRMSVPADCRLGIKTNANMLSNKIVDGMRAVVVRGTHAHTWPKTVSQTLIWKENLLHEHDIVICVCLWRRARSAWLCVQWADALLAKMCPSDLLHEKKKSSRNSCFCRCCRIKHGVCWLPNHIQVTKNSDFRPVTQEK